MQRRQPFLCICLCACSQYLFVCTNQLSFFYEEDVAFMLRQKYNGLQSVYTLWTSVSIHIYVCVFVSKRRERNTVDVAAGLEFPLVCHALTNKYTHTHCHVTLPLQCREGRRKGLSPHCCMGILLKSNVCCVLGASAQHQVLKGIVYPPNINAST